MEKEGCFVCHKEEKIQYINKNINLKGKKMEKIDLTKS